MSLVYFVNRYNNCSRDILIEISLKKKTYQARKKFLLIKKFLQGFKYYTILCTWGLNKKNNPNPKSFIVCKMENTNEMSYVNLHVQITKTRNGQIQKTFWGGYLSIKICICNLWKTQHFTQM